MDTRRVAGSGHVVGNVVEVGTDTGSIELVDLGELRYRLSPWRVAGLGAIVSAVALVTVVAAIALLAIATSNGWSVLDGY